MNDADPLQAHLAAIVDSSDDAILSKDLNGVIQYANPAAERLFGYRLAELVGMSVRALIPPERQSEEAESLEQVRRGERIDHFETIRIRKDGERIPVALTISPVRDGAGNVIGASTVARDITDQKHASAIAEKLAAIVASSDDAIISKDLNGIILSFNAGAERIFGYTASEIVGKSIRVLIPPERDTEETEILRRIVRGERVDHFDTVRVRKDGRRLDISVTVSPVRDASGKIVGASKVARDITDKKRAVAALAEQREWFRVTLNSIGDAVIACDRDGRTLFLNHQAERLTGWALSEAQDRPLPDVFRIIDEHTRAALEDPAALVLRLGHMIELGNHTTLIDRNGTEWPISDTAAPIVDSRGKIVGVVLVFRDITQQKRDEENARVQSIERERLLHSERAARNEAERANRVKDDFVAMVSHELRNPLNAILGWTELLRRPECDIQTREQGLEVVARNTRLQSQLIADLLDVSRIISGKLQLEFDRVDMTEVIRDAIQVMESTLKEKSQELVVQLAKGPMYVFGDGSRLQQIVLNLLSNASKFTPSGGRITIGLRSVNHQAELTIADTGLGIRADFLSEMFDRFRQDSPLTTRRHGGLGLGLSITRHLAQLHGGSVRAWSAGENQGSTFTVEMPLISAERERDLARVDRSDAGASDQPMSLKGLTVLVVEDVLDTRDMIGRLLEAQGAKVALAATAPEALELLGQVRPGVIVSDIGLPDVDGYELIRRVRAMHDATAHIPAIALTAFARPDDKTRALRAGFNAHVAKPVEPTELIATVASFSNLIPSSARSVN